MKRWMMLPLTDLTRINERLNLVEYLILHADDKDNLTKNIKQAGDIERIVSKIPMKKINPREVLQLAKGLLLVEKLKSLCIQSENDFMKRLGDQLNPCRLIADKAIKMICLIRSCHQQRRCHCRWH